MRVRYDIMYRWVDSKTRRVYTERLCAFRHSGDAKLFLAQLRSGEVTVYESTTGRPLYPDKYDFYVLEVNY